MNYLRTRGHEVVILRTLDPTEIEFEFDKASLFRDLETGREIYVDPQAAVAEYRKRFLEHESSIKKTCDQIGVDFFTIATDQPLEVALLELLQSRASNGRSVKRATQVRGPQ